MFSGAIATCAKGGKNAHKGTMNFRFSLIVGKKKAHVFFSQQHCEKMFFPSLLISSDNRELKNGRGNKTTKLV